MGCRTFPASYFVGKSVFKTADTFSPTRNLASSVHHTFLVHNSFRNLAHVDVDASTVSREIFISTFLKILRILVISSASLFFANLPGKGGLILIGGLTAGLGKFAFFLFCCYFTFFSFFLSYFLYLHSLFWWCRHHLLEWFFTSQVHYVDLLILWNIDLGR